MPDLFAELPKIGRGDGKGTNQSEVLLDETSISKPDGRATIPFPRKTVPTVFPKPNVFRIPAKGRSLGISRNQRRSVAAWYAEVPVRRILMLSAMFFSGTRVNPLLSMKIDIPVQIPE